MESMITVFHKYAAKEGSGNTLSRRELKDLMENELSGFLKVAISNTFSTKAASQMVPYSLLKSSALYRQ